MSLLLLLLLFLISPCPAINPALFSWTHISTNKLRIQLPIRDFLLQIKSFLPEDFDVNPVYNETVRTDKSTTMMAVLLENEEEVGRMFWNTIKYTRGYDVFTQQCDVFYTPYKSFPCGRRKEQVWSWRFGRYGLELTCDGEVQYWQNWNEGDELNQAGVALSRSEACRKLGKSNPDAVVLKFMQGAYVRAVPRVGELKIEPSTEGLMVTTPWVTTPSPTQSTSSPLPGQVNFGRDFPTCDCWVAECGYCTLPSCTVRLDMFTSDTGIVVRSELGWADKDLNSIALFDEEGEAIGNLQWGLSGIYMTGCLGCRTPREIRRARSPLGPTSWSFSMKEGVVRLKVYSFSVGEAEFTHRLKGECLERYSKVRRFAFYSSRCGGRFTLQDDMVPGDMVSHFCPTNC